MVRLSGWVRETNDAGIEYARITPEIFRRVTQMRVPGLQQRAMRALAHITRKYHERLDVWFLVNGELDDLELQGRTYSRGAQDVTTLLSILVEEGYLRGSGQYALSVKGLLAVEAMGASQSSSAKGFVAMSFDESLADAWTNGFEPGIRAAGFQPVRIDNKDYVGGIADEIMAEIRQARFVVADYTGQRPGVYFEVGFALGLGLTVLPTCHADEIANLHFDIRHLNTLVWKTPAELCDGLTKRIGAVIGAGPDV